MSDTGWQVDRLQVDTATVATDKNKIQLLTGELAGGLQAWKYTDSITRSMKNTLNHKYRVAHNFANT